jgi:hypothetical protein
MSGALKDDGLIAHMRAQIVEYREGRQSMQSMMHALEWAFAIGSDGLRRIRDMLDEPLLFLDAVVASGGDHSTAVDKALDEIDGALRRMLEQDAA